MPNDLVVGAPPCAMIWIRDEGLGTKDWTGNQRLHPEANVFELILSPLSRVLNLMTKTYRAERRSYIEPFSHKT